MWNSPPVSQGFLISHQDELKTNSSWAHAWRKERPWGRLHRCVRCRLISIHQTICWDWGFRTLFLPKPIHNSCSIDLILRNPHFWERTVRTFRSSARALLILAIAKDFLPSCSYMNLENSKSRILNQNTEQKRSWQHSTRWFYFRTVSEGI